MQPDPEPVPEDVMVDPRQGTLVHNENGSLVQENDPNYAQAKAAAMDTTSDTVVTDDVPVEGKE